MTQDLETLKQEYERLTTQLQQAEAERDQALQAYEAAEDEAIGHVKREMEDLQEHLRKLQDLYWSREKHPKLRDPAQKRRETQEHFRVTRNRLDIIEKKYKEAQRIQKLEAFNDPVKDVKTFQKYAALALPKQSVKADYHTTFDGFNVFKTTWTDWEYKTVTEYHIFDAEGRHVLEANLRKHTRIGYGDEYKLDRATLNAAEDAADVDPYDGRRTLESLKELSRLIRGVKTGTHKLQCTGMRDKIVEA